MSPCSWPVLQTFGAEGGEEDSDLVDIRLLRAAPLDCAPGKTIIGDCLVSSISATGVGYGRGES